MAGKQHHHGNPGFPHGRPAPGCLNQTNNIHVNTSDNIDTVSANHQHINAMSSHVSCVKVNSTAVMLNNLEDSCNVSSDNANSSHYTMSNNADVSFINISNVQANSGEKNIDCNTNEGVDQVIQCDLHLVSIDQCDAKSMHVTPDQNAHGIIGNRYVCMLSVDGENLYPIYLVHRKRIQMCMSKHKPVTQ